MKKFIYFLLAIQAFFCIEGMSEKPDQKFLDEKLFSSLIMGDQGLKLIKKAIEAGANPNAINKDDETPLAVLLRRSKFFDIEKSVDYLLDNGADLQVLIAPDVLGGRQRATRDWAHGLDNADLQALIDLGIFGKKKTIMEWAEINKFQKFIDAVNKWKSKKLLKYLRETQKDLPIATSLWPIIAEYGHEDKVFESGYDEKFEAEQEAELKKNKNL